VPVFDTEVPINDEYRSIADVAKTLLKLEASLKEKSLFKVTEFPAPILTELGMGHNGMVESAFAKLKIVASKATERSNKGKSDIIQEIRK
jgi:hypothetical protein